ncbi:MAG: UDP-glucose 4-epimerase GalE [Arcicella sp.]|jgi:UDP-glucose 4-epimerase|nr:UDP-glucose 4-epimerase GalE [Arcicella sp.]
MRILVTGGAGFIGSHTIVELYKAGYDPVIVDNFSNSEKFILERLKDITGKKTPCYNVDFANSVEVEKIISEEKIQGVIHFAALKAVGDSTKQPLNYYHNNVIGTIKLLEVLLKNNISNFVFSSSCTVYGEPDEIPVKETTKRKPATSPYGNTKMMCEDILRDTVAAQLPIKAISLRYFNPIGAHESGLIGELPRGLPSNLVPFITQTSIGIRKELTVFGDDYNTPDGSCIRDFIHVVDLAKAHVSALNFLKEKTDKSLYDVFNIGTGRGYSVLELIRTFEETCKKVCKYSIGKRREGDIECIYGNVEKANDILNWKAEKTIKEALLDSWRWQCNL